MTLIVEGIVQGTPTTISGNWVSISGAYLASGQAVTVSGDWVDISGVYFASGQVVTVSGDSVFVYISGGSLSLDISGSAVTVSGSWVDISGAYLASGQVVTISGDAVTVSGSWVSVSGSTVVTVEDLNTAFAWQSGTGATAVANTYTALRPVYLDRVDYSAADFTSTASTLYVYHSTADSLTSSILVAVNMVAGSPKNIIWLPDTNPYIVLSGDSILTSFANPDDIDFYTRTVVSWR
jgi:hypothetical protein